METNKTTEKYLKALIDLRLAVKYNNKINITEFCKDYELSKNAAYQLTKGGIIINKGKRGKGADFVWNTIPPNVKMAEELLNRVNSIGKEAMIKSRLKGSEKINIKDLIYGVYFFNIKIFEIKKISK